MDYLRVYYLQYLLFVNVSSYFIAKGRKLLTFPNVFFCTEHLNQNHSTASPAPLLTPTLWVVFDHVHTKKYHTVRARHKLPSSLEQDVNNLPQRS